MNTLKSIRFDEEFFRIEHVADNRPVLRAIQEERQHGNNGWTKSREWQKIGVIPALEYARLVKIDPCLRDAKELEKFLMSSHGAGWRVAEDNPHRSAQIIIH